MEFESASLPYIFSNIVAVCVVFTAMLWPTIARIALSLIFIIASVINIYTAYVDPTVYLGFGELTSNQFYQSIIMGAFSKHIMVYVLILAIGQLLIGIFTLLNGMSMRIAMIGGLLFLLVIAPLEIGSAFPSTLILAMAFIILLRKKVRFNVYHLLRNKMNYSN